MSREARTQTLDEGVWGIKFLLAYSTVRFDTVLSASAFRCFARTRSLHAEAWNYGYARFCPVRSCPELSSSVRVLSAGYGWQEILVVLVLVVYSNVLSGRTGYGPWPPVFSKTGGNFGPAGLGSVSQGIPECGYFCCGSRSDATSEREIALVLVSVLNSIALQCSPVFGSYGAVRLRMAPFYTKVDVFI